MSDAIARYQAWQRDYNSRADACRAEIRALQARAAASARAFEAEQAPFVQVAEAWVTETNEFNARGASSASASSDPQLPRSANLNVTDTCSQLRASATQLNDQVNDMASPGAGSAGIAQGNQAGTMVAARNNYANAYNRLCSGNVYQDGETTPTGFDYAIGAYEAALQIYNAMNALNEEQQRERQRLEVERQRLAALREERQQEIARRDAAYLPTGGEANMIEPVAADLRARGTPECPTLGEARAYCSSEPPWWRDQQSAFAPSTFSSEACAIQVQSYAFGTRACTARRGDAAPGELRVIERPGQPE